MAVSQSDERELMLVLDIVD